MTPYCQEECATNKINRAELAGQGDDEDSKVESMKQDMIMWKHCHQCT